MTAHDPSLHRRQPVLLRWLGLAPRKGSSENEAAPAASPDAQHPAISRQFEEIGSFLVYHDLEVCAQTLGIACDYFNGTDPKLVRLIDQKVQADERVTREWLDEVTSGPDENDEMTQLNNLMERLESSIEEFGKTSREAQVATSQYGFAMEGHVGELEQVVVAGEMISELATITKVMINRTRDIEKQMQRSEAQTRVLKRRLEETRHSAEHDHLTGLPNRRAFEQRFEEDCRIARESGEGLSVAFCDIDHFKRVNDTHGHEAGDRVLRVVAECLARISGDRCHVARHGGEEFVLLFRDELARDARIKLDTLREELSKRRLVNRANEMPFGQITFSAGIADVLAHPDRSSALKAADAALYRAKEAGRNQILVAEVPQQHAR
jgi:diguanylate cyclase